MLTSSISSFAQAIFSAFERIGERLFRHRSHFFGTLLICLPFLGDQRNALHIFGVSVIVLGLIIRLIAVLSIGAQSRTQIAKKGEERLLVTDGLYSITRNPLYFANILLWVGASLCAGLSGGTFLVLFAVFAAYWLIIRYEESAWSHIDSYNMYCIRVPRWPSLRGAINNRKELGAAISVPSTQWLVALRSERPSIATAICFVALIGGTNVS